MNAPEFKAATNFYVNLIKAHGEPGASQAGFTECLNALSQGKVAMWYDATSAAGSLEDPSVSKVAGKIGYVQAPVEKTKASGWLWTWAFVMPKTTKKADEASKFMLWATSKDYESWSATSSAGPVCRPASGRAPTRSRSTRRRPPRSAADAPGDRGGRPGEPGRAAAADRRCPVRRHPGVPGPRHQGRARTSRPPSPAAGPSTTPSTGPGPGRGRLQEADQ